jgi:uncharacterized protein YjbI with pentapeptide repeats
MERSWQTTSLVIISLLCWQGLGLGDAIPAAAAASASARNNLQQLLKTRSCKACDLAELDLTRLDLSGVDIQGADLSRAKLYLANLSGADMRNTKLNGAVFGGADLGKADLRGADLHGASLDNAYLGGTLMDSAPKQDPPPEAKGQPEPGKQTAGDTSAPPKETGVPDEGRAGGATDAVGSPAPLGTDQTAKDKTVAALPAVAAAPPAVVADAGKGDGQDKDPGAEDAGIAEGKSTAPVNDAKKLAAPTEDEIRKGNLARLLDKNKCFACDLSGLDLSGKDLEGADLEKANLSDCNLEKADLDEANLKGALLPHANLRRASLEKADLYEADLTGADLTDAKIKGAMFDGAKTTEAIGFKGTTVLLNKE